MPNYALKPNALRRRCALSIFPFRTTQNLPEPKSVLGQSRAIEALEVGMGIERHGFNLYVLGPPGFGRHTVTRKFVKKVAKKREIPDAWCYVHNFEDSKRPRVLRLPAQIAKRFVSDMSELIGELRSVIIATLESDEYRSRREAIEQDYKERQEKGIEDVQTKAEKVDITLVQTESGIGFAPMKKGEIIPPDEYAKLPNKERKKIEKNVGVLQEELTEVFQKVPRWVREGQKRVQSLNEEVIEFAIDEPIEELKQRYNELPRVAKHLDAMKKDVIENALSFVPASLLNMGEDEELSFPVQTESTGAEARGFDRYQVNAMGHDLKPPKTAPVIYEDHPTYQNLIGQVEHISKDGVFATDFSLIKPGALHLANGGYLLLDARRLLSQPYAYEGLKLALRAQQIRIQSPAQHMSVFSTVTLDPEPIPLDVKVILIGERDLYYQLCEYDPEFSDLFKVAADFEETIEWTDRASVNFANLLGSLVRSNSLLPLDKRGVARVVEYSSRLCADAQKLSIHIKKLADLLREADFWAKKQKNARVINERAIDKAIEAQQRRDGRVRELMQEQVLRETILIDTEGERVGQINGLAVLQLGTTSFGRPSRISCSTRVGNGELIDIEREVKLGGPLHSKGVLILGGFLGTRFGQKAPLHLSARLVFEQSYGGIDGDSASSAELYTLLSALSGVPIYQGIAVTGSVNQLGEVQAIGGVNEKIEGFFDLCKTRGLNGKQGVLIPESNIKHLMLDNEVVDAVKRKKFSIYAVRTIDEGIKILTGVDAGKPRADGSYAPKTINGLIAARLASYAEYANGTDKDNK